MEKIEVNSERWFSLEDLEGEVWKDVVGYEGLYMISSEGRVKSIYYPLVYLKNKTAVILKCFKNNGYPCATLLKNKRRTQKKIHRLIAEAFIPNPKNLPFINHKDENRNNSVLSNIEWCDQKYNTNYGSAPERRRNGNIKSWENKCKLIKQYSLDGILLNTYRGKTEIENAGFNYSHAYWCCRKRNKTSQGYIWRFDNDPFCHAIYNTSRNSLKKRVNCYDLNGNLIQSFESISDASLFISQKENKESLADVPRISSCCNGKRKTYKGYVWRFNGKPFTLTEDKNNKPVEQYDINGNFIRCYISVSEAAKILGIKPDGIYKCASKINKTAYGYIWKYKKNKYGESANTII